MEVRPKPTAAGEAAPGACLLHDAIIYANSTDAAEPSSAKEKIEQILTEYQESIDEVDPRTIRHRRPNLTRSTFTLKTGRLPFHTAIECGRYDLAHYLLTQRPEHAKVWYHNQTTSGFSSNGLTTGQLALHAIFYDSHITPPVPFVKDLVDAFPEALALKDCNGSIPLLCGVHWLDRRVAAGLPGTSVIQPLLEEYPQAATTANGKGNFPFQLAVETGQLALVRMMTEKHPILLQPSQVYNPFYKVCLGGDHEMARLLLEKGEPKALLTTPTLSLNLPIHILVASGEAPYGSRLPIHSDTWHRNRVDILLMIVKHAPETVMSRSRNGMLPIHILLGSKHYRNHPDAKLEMTRILLSHAPSSMLWSPTVPPVGKYVPSGGSQPGDLPIHIAAAEGSLDVLKMLARKEPGTLLAKNNAGFLPIHKSIGGHEYSFFLAQTEPGSLSFVAPVLTAADGGGPLLHLTVNGGKFSSRIGQNSPVYASYFNYLLSNSPLGESDRYGDNILHIALHKNLPLHLLQSLLLALKEKDLISSLLLQTNWLGRTPLHYLAALAPPDAHRIMTRNRSLAAWSTPDLVRTKAIIDQSPPQVLCQALLVKQWTNPGGTVLHQFLLMQGREGATITSDHFEQIKLLVDACPESLLTKGCGGGKVNPQYPFEISMVRHGSTMHLTKYLFGSIRIFDLDVLLATTATANGSLAFEYLNRFVGEWAQQSTVMHCG